MIPFKFFFKRYKAIFCDILSCNFKDFGHFIGIVKLVGSLNAFIILFMSTSYAIIVTLSFLTLQT